MPLRKLAWGLVVLTTVLQALPAQAQFRRTNTANRGRYQDFMPGPAMAGKNAINPEHEKIKSKAQEAYRKHDFKRAIELVNTVLRVKPEDTVGLYIRGSAQIGLGVRDGNVEMVRTGIKDARAAVSQGADDGNGAVYYIPYLHGMINLAKMERRKEHAEVALDIAGQVLELPDLTAGQKANLRFQRAAAFSYLAKFEDAAGEYRKAIEIDNSHIGAYVALADALAKADKPEEARAAYDTAVEAFQNSTLVRNNRGTYLRSLGKLEEAIADFSAAVEIDSQFIVGYINRGYTNMQLGRPAAAERDFDKVIKLNPERKNILELRGQARVAQGKLKDGIADIKVVTTTYPKYAKGHANLGFALYFDGDYEGSLKALDAAVALDPSLKYLDTWRLLCRVELETMEGVKKDFEDTFAKPEDKRDWVDNLVLYLADEQTAEELLAVIDPKDEKRSAQQTCEAQFVIARRLLKAGETDKANEHLKKVIDSDAKYLSAYRAAQYQLGTFDVAEKPTDLILN